MNILLVNDDGFGSNGILKAEEILKRYGTVYVVAPSFPQSGKSASINVFHGVDYHKVDEFHYKVDGSPVDCVEIGEVLINVKFDLLVSGCNFGHNIAQDITYSGTCGACFQGLLDGLKAIAISHPFNNDFSDLDSMLPLALDYIFKNNLLSNKYYLNVNFPDVISNKILITSVKENIKEKLHIVKHEGNHIVIDRTVNKSSKDMTNDRNAINNGYISICPISMTSFNKKYFKQLNKKVGCKY